MNPITCGTCGHEFDTPARDRAGPGCPRCGELIGAPGPEAPSAVHDVLMSVALGVSYLGVLAAAYLITQS
jgi:hypothetical protein